MLQTSQNTKQDKVIGPLWAPLPTLLLPTCCGHALPTLLPASRFADSQRKMLTIVQTTHGRCCCTSPPRQPHTMYRCRWQLAPKLPTTSIYASVISGCYQPDTCVEAENLVNGISSPYKRGCTRRVQPLR
jgi:hypothetical protein